MAKDKPSLNTVNFTAAQLMEFDACTRCGECVKYCPTYDARDKSQDIEPRDKIQRWKDYMNKSYGLKARLFGPEKIPPRRSRSSRMTFTTAQPAECVEQCALPV